ncbi:MAG: LemA family protein [Candidatus Blackburnbacteria bacterium]|nr:LemA family protein [Candidatus Blackburnbacteria bacterium]
MDPILIIVIVVLFAGGYLLVTYNSFAGLKVRIRASIQEIGNQLKRQADLIPNIESSAKGYLKHERSIYKDLTEARKAVAQAQKTGSLKDAEKAGKLISDFLPRFQVLVESNPEMKGAEVVRQLMEELRDSADKIMYSRRTFIDLVADYNTMRVQFPSSIIARMFGFSEERGLTAPEKGTHLEVSVDQTKTPKIEL